MISGVLEFKLGFRVVFPRPLVVIETIPSFSSVHMLLSGELLRITR
jgi:hypothetical protein